MGEPAPPSPVAAPAPRARLAVAAALVAAVAAAYATSFQGGFQLDDFRVIAGDPRVASLAAWWRSMPGIRPLLKLTYALNHGSGLGLAGFHLVNVAIHATAAVLAHALLLRLGRRLGLADARPPALLGALLFALHPVQTEAVTYLSGRSSSLSGMLALGSALAFVAGRDRGRPALVHLASPALLALALGVKETAAVLPAALLLVEALEPRPFSWRTSLRAVSAHLAVALGAAAAFLASPVYRSMLARSFALRPPDLQLLSHAKAIAWLGGQLVPIRGLSADPDLAPAAAWTAGGALAAGAVLAAAAAALLFLRRRPAPAFAVLWFLAWLAPQGWWLPRAELASERQLYVALLGPAWLAGIALARLPGPRALRAAIAGALLLTLGGATAARSRVYRDEVRFGSDAVAKAPANARAHGNLGWALALACRTDEAAAAFRRAAALDPEDPRPRVNLRLLREGALLPEDAQAACRAPRGAGAPVTAP